VDGETDQAAASAPNREGGAEEAPQEPLELTPDEQAALVETEESAPVVSYSGQDFDVSGLVRRLTQDDILIPTFGHHDERISSAGFQRSFVWTRPQMDRFIESLLLGYPIPGIFLVRQTDRRYLVLDGQQRMRTLRYFYEGVYGDKVFALQNVVDDLRGLTYKTLSEEHRRLLDDTFIQATIVATDGSTESLEAIYKIFERLNSGGTQLTPHEIRVALFAGPFIDYLERLNSNGDWRAIYGKRSPRLRDQELVLRIISLYMSGPGYRSPLKTFLNGIAAQHRNLGTMGTELVESRFVEASRLISTSVGSQAVRLDSYQVNAALAEAIYVGLMRRLDHGTQVTIGEVPKVVESIRTDSVVQAAVSRATANEENVRIRLEIATARFAEL
jgi:hypothetical protein